MNTTFTKATTKAERDAINLFLLRHNKRGPGSKTGYVAYYAAMADNTILAAAKFCPLHTPTAARFFAGDDWRGVYCLQRLAAKRPYPENMLSSFLGWCLREMGKDTRVHFIATYADTNSYGPDGRPHNGGIYRATNAVYCGQSAGGRIEGYIYNGVRSSMRKGPKTLRKADIPISAKIIRGSAKHRYCWPVGSRLNRNRRCVFLFKRMAPQHHFEPVYQPRLLLKWIEARVGGIL